MTNSTWVAVWFGLSMLVAFLSVPWWVFAVCVGFLAMHLVLEIWR